MDGSPGLRQQIAVAAGVRSRLRYVPEFGERYAHLAQRRQGTSAAVGETAALGEQTLPRATISTFVSEPTGRNAAAVSSNAIVPRS